MRLLFEPSSSFLWPLRLPSSPFRFLLALQAPLVPSGPIWPFRHPVWPFRRPVWPFRHLQFGLPAIFQFWPIWQFSPWLAGSRATLDAFISQSRAGYRRGVEHLLVALRAVDGPAEVGPGPGPHILSRVVGGFSRSGSGWWGGEVGVGQGSPGQREGSVCDC